MKKSWRKTITAVCMGTMLFSRQCLRGGQLPGSDGVYG